MKNFRICVESYYSNNSDVKEYDIYYLEAPTLNDAKDYMEACFACWSKKDQVSYFIYDIIELKKGGYLYD